MSRGVMLNKVRIHDLVSDYVKFKAWIERRHKLSITEFRKRPDKDDLIDQFEDYIIDMKYEPIMSFKKRTGISYSTFRDFARRRVGKKMSELTEEEKDDLVIDYKVEKGLYDA